MGTQSCTPPMAMDVVAVPWSELPDDVITTVASFLPSLADLLRFRAVCRSWRHAGAACAPPPLPYLMFSSKADAPTCCLYSISDGRIHRVKFPEEARSWRCCGSSHGWLAMAGLDAGVCLFNPMSGARLELPPLTTLSDQVLHVVTGPETDTYAVDEILGRPSPDDGDCTYPWYVVDSNEGYPCRWTPKQLRDDLVQKVVASPVTASDPSDCTVMVLYNDYKVAYARPGDDSWASLGGAWSSPWYDAPWFEDLVYHENYRFYLLTWSHAVWAVDFAGAGGREPRMEDLAPKRSRLLELPLGGFLSCLSVARPSGTVLLVHRHLYRESHPRRTEAFQVWKLEVRGGGSWWVEAEDLGGCTLFLGGDCSTSVAAAPGGGGCTPDSVYFTADNLEFRYYGEDKESACVLEGGTYHLKGRTMVEGLLPAGCDDVRQHPVWISPSL